MFKIKTLLKNNKLISVGFIVILLLFLAIYLSPRNTPQVPPVNTISTPKGQNPPVVQVGPELKYIKAIPLEGNRETFDTFSKTFFEFSADLDQSSANVVMSPYIAVKATVYESEKKVLVVEPIKTPWIDGVEYTITINSGLRGVAGEELRQEIKYRFSVTQPAVFEGGDPIPTK